MLRAVRRTCVKCGGAGALPSSGSPRSPKLVTEAETRNNLRRMSVEFMSEEVKRMSLLAVKSAKGGKEKKAAKKQVRIA